MIQKNEVRYFSNIHFTYEKCKINTFRCVEPSDHDPNGLLEQVRAEPFPNPCQPPYAGNCWFSKEEWEQGTLVERGAS